MATTRKVLGQATVSPATPTSVYTVPASTEAVISSITICNVGESSDTVYVLVAVDGEATAYKQAIYWHCPVNAKETFVATIGITLSAADQIVFQSTTGSSSINIFGMEIT